MSVLYSDVLLAISPNEGLSSQYKIRGKISPPEINPESHVQVKQNTLKHKQMIEIWSFCY